MNRPFSKTPKSSTQAPRPHQGHNSQRPHNKQDNNRKQGSAQTPWVPKPKEYLPAELSAVTVVSLTNAFKTIDQPPADIIEVIQTSMFWTSKQRREVHANVKTTVRIGEVDKVHVSAVDFRIDRGGYVLRDSVYFKADRQHHQPHHKHN